MVAGESRIGADEPLRHVGVSCRTDGFITDYLGNEASAVSINHGEELLLVRRVNSPSMRANPGHL